MKIFSKIFGKNNSDNFIGSDKRDNKIESINKKRTKLKPQEIDISRTNYIPLPKAPEIWKVKEKKHGKTNWDWLNNKVNYQIYRAYNEQKYNKVISFCDQISEKYLQGEPGNLLLKSYRKIIQNWQNKNRPKVAIKWSAEMSEKLAFLINDTDRRRHNKIIDQLDKEGVKHSFKKFEIIPPKTELEPKFKLVTENNWRISAIHKIPQKERPDVSFKDHFFIQNGILSIDTKGRVKGFENFKSVLSITNVQGEINNKGLAYDIYRSYINPINSGFAFLSSGCVMHVYNINLEQVSIIDLKEFSQIKKFQGYLSTFDELKRYIRCIAVAPSMDKYLFTIVDEAWCIDKWGNTIWCLKSPIKKGFTKFTTRSETVAPKSEIEKALRFMGISFPYNHEDVKIRYRELAKKYHPDLNPNDKDAKSKFQELQKYYEYLTGSKPPQIQEENEIAYYRDDSTYSKTEIPGIGFLEMGMMYGGIAGVDWIYSASFSNKTDNAFIGTYSGRIIELDPYGNAINVFDIGNVPDSIIETEDSLYIITGTRLYLLKDYKLISLQDVFEQEKLLIAKNGFGLLSSKKLQLFSNKGNKLLELISKDPIRRISIKADKLSIETRQDKAELIRV
ncbi:MAG: J domain-containing protein [Candidatus Helarchaeota archaeon]